MKLYSATGTAVLMLAVLVQIATGGRPEPEALSFKSLTEESKPTETKVIEKIDTAPLSKEKRSWYFKPNSDHSTPQVQGGLDYGKYSAYYVGDTAQSVIYLTFDEGYENGYTSKILDVLKEKNVQAAFFVTEGYIKSNTALVKRMAEEGHIVGNHSIRHLSSPDLSDEELFYEINETAWTYKKLTGYDMPKVFRPPMGEYSERSLAVAHNMGYKTIFWSFAYRDWVTDDQPGKQVAYDTVMSRYHNGAILLLHAVSSSNTEALPDIIDALRAKGYRFGTLDELS